LLLASKDREPSIGLINALEKVPLLVLTGGTGLLSAPLPAVMERLVGQGGLEVALARLCGWLGRWVAPSTALFVLFLLRKLSAAPGNQHLLSKVAEAVAPVMAARLILPIFRKQLEEIFCFLLYGSQNSPNVFHSLVRPLADLIPRLKSDPTSASFLRRLTEAVRYFTVLFPKPRALYASLESVLEDEEEITEERQLQLGSLAWSKTSDGPLLFGLDESRDGGRRVGLINLGNTCYINSVIQALFHISSFRAEVLTSNPPETRPLLSSLQQVFIFLSYSLRSILSPSELVRLARPPWFPSGQQQDCSEFFVHLLDSLQEEERAAPGFKEVTVQELLPTQDSRVPATAATDRIKVSVNLMEVVEEEESCKDAREDEDLSPNASSGRSLNIRRWSTEENLSVKEGELMRSRETGLNLSCGSMETEEDEGRREEETRERLSGSTDSGIQSLGVTSQGRASTRACTEESSLPPSAAPPAPTPSPTLVNRVFGGLLETSYTCLTCRHVSRNVGWFTNLDVAVPSPQLPSSVKSSSPVSKPTSNAPKVPDEQIDKLKNEIPAEDVDGIKKEDPRVSLSGVKETGTSVSPTHSSSNSLFKGCTSKELLPGPGVAETPLETSSSKDESPVSIDPVKVQSERLRKALSGLTEAGSSSAPLPPSPAPCVESLLAASLAPEVMAGENQYQCDSCHHLRDALKELRVVAPPQHLVVTLLRFKYDTERGFRAKVVRWLETPRHLSLGGASFRLSAVVVHSGASAEGGHYFTWARDHRDTGRQQNPDKEQWLLLDDSRVTSVSWATFRQRALGSSGGSDTPYLLFYSQEGTVSPAPPSPSPPSHKMDSLERDNMSFLRSKHQATTTPSTGQPWHWPEDQEPPEGGAGGACNDNFGQFGGGRFVC